MKDQKTLFSKKSDDWKTPTKIYNYFMKIGCKDCFKYQSTEDELQKNYKNELLFINPPFSKIKTITAWIKKQSNQKNNNIIFLLIPARTDTKYFHELLNLDPVIYFIKGRLHYNDKDSAPFPTLLLIISKNKTCVYGNIDQSQIEYEI